MDLNVLFKLQFYYTTKAFNPDVVNAMRISFILGHVKYFNILLCTVYQTSEVMKTRVSL